MSRDYDDRPKRSWRDIDKMKDGSKHRQPDRPKMSGKNQARANSASKVYKSKLDAFFDGEGKAPEHVKEKMAVISDSSKEGKSRAKALGAIKDAGTSSAMDKAVEEYLKKWELPPDFDILSQVLTCSDEEYLEKALEMIEELLQQKRIPKHITLLEQRLRRVKTLADDPDLAEKATKITRDLRLFS